MRPEQWQDVNSELLLNPLGEQQLTQDLADRRSDIALNITSFSQSPHQSAYVCYGAGNTLCVCASKEFDGSLLTAWVQSVNDTQDQVDRPRSLLLGVEITPQSYQLKLHLPLAAQPPFLQELRCDA